MSNPADEDPRPIKLNRRLLAYLRTVQSSNGEYIWKPGLEKGEPSKLFGRPYELIDEPPIPRVDKYIPPDDKFLRDLLEELNRARLKHPDAFGLLAALMEEVGEIAKAMLDESKQNVRAEAMQAASTAWRLAVEGDRSLNPLRRRKNLELLG